MKRSKFKFVSLLSEGFDSPVASYLLIKKRFTPIFLSFLTSATQNDKMKRKIIAITKKLSEFTPNSLKLYFINHVSNLENIKKNAARKLTCVLCKRLMYRIAKRICQSEDINIFVTGDILGEQASQTLDNLYIYSDLLANYTKLSPLIGFNKLEILEISRQIGLYQICAEKLEACQYNPQYPETHAKKKEVKKNEERLKLNDMIDHSINNAEILYI
ncbi:MAG: hypothetical protein ACOC4M_04920 [Promethearchaeia archaeon]